MSKYDITVNERGGTVLFVDIPDETGYRFKLRNHNEVRKLMKSYHMVDAEKVMAGNPSIEVTRIADIPEDVFDDMMREMYQVGFDVSYPAAIRGKDEEQYHHNR